MMLVQFLKRPIRFCLFLYRDVSVNHRSAKSLPLLCRTILCIPHSNCYTTSIRTIVIKMLTPFRVQTNYQQNPSRRGKRRDRMKKEKRVLYCVSSIRILLHSVVHLPQFGISLQAKYDLTFKTRIRVCPKRLKSEVSIRSDPQGMEPIQLALTMWSSSSKS